MNFIKKISATFFLLFLTVGLLHARQSNNVLKQINGSNDYNSYSTEYSQLGGTIKVVGSPLIKEEFTTGKVIYKGQMISEDVKLNYDTFTNQLIFEDNDEFYVIPTTDVIGFYFVNKQGDRDEAFLLGFENKKEGIDYSTFMEVLYNGEVKLFKYHYTNYRKDEANIYNPRETDYYTSKSKYMVLDKNGELKEIKLKKKDLFKVFNDRKSELDDFAKSNDLNLKDLDDVKKLLAYYDTLNMK